jgi:hypothetical protein
MGVRVRQVALRAGQTFIIAIDSGRSTRDPICIRIPYLGNLDGEV